MQDVARGLFVVLSDQSVTCALAGDHITLDILQRSYRDPVPDFSDGNLDFFLEANAVVPFDGVRLPEKQQESVLLRHSEILAWDHKEHEENASSDSGGSVYVPSSEGASSDEELPEYNELEITENDSEPLASTPQEEKTESDIVKPQEKTTESEIIKPQEEKTECEVVKPKVIGKKQYCCKFCHELVVEYSHHLKRQHKTEPAVIEIIDCKSKKERNKLIAKLRNEGSYYYNKGLSDKEQHKAILKRRHNKVVKEDFLTCNFCLGRYRRIHLTRHQCLFKSPSKSISQKEASHLEEPSGESSHKLRELVFKSMQNGLVKLYVKSDPLLVRFGCLLCSKLDSKAQGHKINDVSQRLRSLGGFVQEVQKLDPSIKNLSECLRGENYQKVVEVVKKLGGFQEDKNRFEHGSVPSKLGNHVATCAEIKLALVSEDDLEVKKTKGFLHQKKVFWQYEITHASESGKNERAQKRIELPQAKDVQLLNQFREKQTQKACDALLETPSRATYRQLMEHVLARCITFNRRRSGEVARMPLTCFTERGTIMCDQEEVTACLSIVARKLEKMVTRLVIVGKRGRFVPVLLMPTLLYYMDVLVKHRQVSGIDTENKFLFGIPGDDTSVIRGCDVMRKMADRCGAEKPRLLTSTHLRKHVATCSQLLCLKDHELQQFSDFIGHTKDVHNKHYVIPQGTIQQTQVSKILIAMRQGSLQKYRGKTLAEMNVSVGLSSSSEDEDNFEGEPRPLMESVNIPRRKSPSAKENPKAKKSREATRSEPGKCNDENAAPHNVSSSEEEVAIVKELKVTKKKAQTSDENFVPSPLESDSEDDGKPQRSRKTKKTQRREYSNDEIIAMKRELLDCIRQKRTPRQNDVQNAQLRAPILRNIPWNLTKCWVYNFNKSNARDLDNE